MRVTARLTLTVYWSSVVTHMTNNIEMTNKLIMEDMNRFLVFKIAPHYLGPLNFIEKLITLVFAN